ncbi:MAG: DUF3048 domain-containing protein [Bacilli bacterium]
MKLNVKRILLVVIPVVIILGVILYFVFNKPEEIIVNKDKPKEEVKKLKIVDLDSNSRPVAVMINNHHEAWPHAGLQDAYLVYEMIVEGGITRMLAVFKDANTAKIGSVRSSRHYFLDYALENDAIYTHFGWSPQAQQDIPDLGINNINGLFDAGFWRDTSLDKATEHTAFTSMPKLQETIKNKGYRNTSNKDLLLNYSVPEINLENIEGSKKADNIKIVYSNYQTSTYQYDSTNKVYKRSMSGVEHVDSITGKQYTVKNIITYKVKNNGMDSYGRQELSNIGSGEGYYISNGYAVPIKWSKSSREAQTVYTYNDGKEITVNDGNTFIQIQPIGQNLEITSN